MDTHRDRPVLSVMTSARSMFWVVSAKASFRFCHVQFHGRLCTTTCTRMHAIMHLNPGVEIPLACQAPDGSCVTGRQHNANMLKASQHATLTNASKQQWNQTRPATGMWLEQTAVVAPMHVRACKTENASNPTLRQDSCHLLLHDDGLRTRPPFPALEPADHDRWTYKVAKTPGKPSTPLPLLKIPVTWLFAQHLAVSSCLQVDYEGPTAKLPVHFFHVHSGRRHRWSPDPASCCYLYPNKCPPEPDPSSIFQQGQQQCPAFPVQAQAQNILNLPCTPTYSVTSRVLSAALNSMSIVCSGQGCMSYIPLTLLAWRTTLSAAPKTPCHHFSGGCSPKRHASKVPFQGSVCMLRRFRGRL